MQELFISISDLSLDAAESIIKSAKSRHNSLDSANLLRRDNCCYLAAWRSVSIWVVFLLLAEPTLWHTMLWVQPQDTIVLCCMLSTVLQVTHVKTVAVILGGFALFSLLYFSRSVDTVYWDHNSWCGVAECFGYHCYFAGCMELCVLQVDNTAASSSYNSAPDKFGK